jgi:hypothetical protein
VPVFSNERSRLTAGVQWRWNGLDFEHSPTFSDSLDLYRLQLPIDFWHSFDDRWKAWGRVEPGLFTDFENIDGDAFAVTVLALGSYQLTEQFSAAFGVYYSRDLGEDRVLPTLGVIWKPDPHWNVGLTSAWCCRRKTITAARLPRWALPRTNAGTPSNTPKLTSPCTGAWRRWASLPTQTKS